MGQAAKMAKEKADAQAKKVGCKSSTDFKCLSDKGTKAASEIADKAKALTQDLADKAAVAAAVAKS